MYDLKYHLREALMDAKVRGVSRKDRCFIRCELLLELAQEGGLVGIADSEDLVGVDVLAELSALNMRPGRAQASRRDILLAIEEYAKWGSSVNAPVLVP